VSQQGLGALMILAVTCGRCFVDDFPVGTDSIFVDLIRVNRGCERFRIHASPLKAVFGDIFESATTHLSLTISESTGAVGSDESTRHLTNQFC
jgi:hypothetical protein